MPNTPSRNGLNIVPPKQPQSFELHVQSGTETLHDQPSLNIPMGKTGPAAWELRPETVQHQPVSIESAGQKIPGSPLQSELVPNGTFQTDNREDQVLPAAPTIPAQPITVPQATIAPGSGSMNPAKPRESLDTIFGDPNHAHSLQTTPQSLQGPQQAGATETVMQQQPPAAVPAGLYEAAPSMSPEAMAGDINRLPTSIARETPGPDVPAAPASAPENRAGEVGRVTEAAATYAAVNETIPSPVPANTLPQPNGAESTPPDTPDIPGEPPLIKSVADSAPSGTPLPSGLKTILSPAWSSKPLSFINEINPLNNEVQPNQADQWHAAQTAKSALRDEQQKNAA